MQKYETIYVVQPNLADEQVDELIHLFEAVIPQTKGTLIKTDKWGKRRLAYRIGPHWEGYYVVFEYEGDGATQRELERRMRIHEDVLRHMTVAVDPRMAAELIRRAEREKRLEGRRDDEDARGRRAERPGPLGQKAEAGDEQPGRGSRDEE